jgi:nucleotide-binding universal stress UspA family protein
MTMLACPPHRHDDSTKLDSLLPERRMTNPTTSATSPTSRPRDTRSAGRQLLVATSGEDGTAALRAAELLAPLFNSYVTLVSAIEPEPGAPYDTQFGFLSSHYLASRVEIRQADLQRQLQSLSAGAAAWRTDLVLGPAPDAIADEAHRLGASLIIMDSGRHDRMTRLLAGETTLRTIRCAQTPVLSVAGEFDALPRTAVAAIDFSASSIAAARAVLGLLADHATLYLVHVWSRSASDHPSERERDDAYERQLPGLFDRLEEALAAPPGITLHRITLLGAPVEELLQLAATHGVQLIAAGRRGHGFFQRLLVGSVTTALVRGARCSVLVTPEPSPVEADQLSRSVTGAFESHAPEEWAVQLDIFSRHNRGRRVVLEVDDPHVGTQTQAAGYALFGVAYDHNDRRVEIMLGDPENETTHLTHTIRDVATIAVRSNPGGRDEVLRIVHHTGEALLRFLPSNTPASESGGR